MHGPERVLGFGLTPSSYFLERGISMEVNDIIALYVECIQTALPFAFTFWGCDYLVTTVIRCAFGGRLTLRS